MDKIQNYDPNNYNQIDLECNIVDDDDDFGTKIIDFSSNNTGASVDESIITGADDRPLQRHTGIIIDLRDDDDIDLGVIKADIDPYSEGIKITSPKNLDSTPRDYNSIDMETQYGDDDMELIPEELVDERRKVTKLTQGQVEDDYWEKMTKKHNKTIKKDAYVPHYHFAGNPEREAELFNAGVGAQSNNNSSADSAGSGAEGISENVTPKLDYSKKLTDLLAIIGFDVKKTNSGYVVTDLIAKTAQPLQYETLQDVITFLTPFIQDCITNSLEVETGETRDGFDKWCDPQLLQKYPQCASDIAYCDLIANHLSECNI